jgi:hypothetical protein
MDLIREILLVIEDQPAGKMMRTIQLPEQWSHEEVVGHLRLISQAGLIDGKIEILGKDLLLAIHGLSNEGHDLLDSIRNETVWESTKETVARAGGSVAIETLKSIAAAAMAKLLGLG